MSKKKRAKTKSVQSIEFLLKKKKQILLALEKCILFVGLWIDNTKLGYSS